MTRPVPDLVIIGAMKSATTTLHHYVAAHPSIATSPGKELDFFSHDDVNARGVEWYLRQFGDTGSVRLDSSPNYTKRHLWPATAGRLAASGPEATLVYIVREPISRTRSSYLHDLAAGREHRPPSQALADLSVSAVATSRYHWQLEPYLEHFDRSRLHVVRFDEVVSRPLDVVNRVLLSVDLEPLDALPDDVPRNETSRKTMPTRLARAIPDQRARGILRRIHPRLADAALPDVTFDDDLRRHLADHLGPDLEALQRSGLVDVSDWLAAL